MFALVGRSVESLRQVARGLGTVFKHVARTPITKEFPDTMPDIPGHFRGRLALCVNPQTGEHLCISCLQCERVCPDKCIQITSHKSPETNKPELINFKIDHGLCMFCGLCAEVCPTSCIINTNDFEMSDYTRAALVYDLKKLTLTQEESAYYYAKKQLPMPKPKPAKPAAKPAAAAAEKPAPDKPDGKPEAKAEAKPEAKPDLPADKPAAPKAEDTKEAVAQTKSAETTPDAGGEKQKVDNYIAGASDSTPELKAGETDKTTESIKPETKQDESAADKSDRKKEGEQ